MELFYNHNNIENNNKYNKLIKCNFKKINEFNLFTYKLKRDDDKCYFNNPELIKLLPRSMTIIKHDKDIFILKGMCKFSGYSILDEDKSSYQIYDHKKTLDWMENKQCKIISIKKANGKLAILKIIIYNNIKYIIFGSKNNHHITTLDNLEMYVKNKTNELVKTIGIDIINNIDNIINLFNNLEDDYSLIGELEDGKHFTYGDNTIAWFGLFKDGISKDPIDTINLLKKYDLKTLEYNIIFDNYKSYDLNNILLNLRCHRDIEGYVLYIKNTLTDEIQMCKLKTTMYIFKRFFRQIWLHKPLSLEESFKNRVIDAQTYHLLNTETSIYLTRVFFDFALWLLNNRYPTQKLNFMGEDTGFYTYWDKFSKEYDISDLDVTNFGEFNMIDYKFSKKIILFNTDINKISTVIFLQHIQGIGKTKIADNLNDFVKIEQDDYNKCTELCTFDILKNLLDGKNIIISRCNINQKQYHKYLELCKKFTNKIIFISSNDTDTYFYLGLGLAGIYNRSSKNDIINLGKDEFNFKDVIPIIISNWTNFKYHKNTIKLNSFEYNDDINTKIKNLINNYSELSIFIKENYISLIKLKKDNNILVDEIKNNIIEKNYICKDLKNIVYIGLVFSNDDKLKLIDIIKKYCNLNNQKIYCDHVTLFHKNDNELKYIKEYQYYKIKITSLIIDKSTNSSLFKIEDFDNFKNLHITASVNLNNKPSYSKKILNKNNDCIEKIDLSFELNTVLKWIN